MEIRLSKDWLQSYFGEQLPPDKEIAKKLTFFSYEVAGAENIGNDSIFKIDILPNRAHDSLCHFGVAREIGLLFELPMISGGYSEPLTSKDILPPDIFVEDSSFCKRYASRVIKNIKVGPSPDWLKGRLEAIGQKSINNVVDAANYVMFSIGQPVHVFDYEKITDSGGRVSIQVKSALEREEITTLDGKALKLSTNISVISSGGVSLAVAGVKGGSRDAVVEHTEGVILEVANFDNVAVRKAAKSLGIRTDSSARYEHGLSPNLVTDGMNLLTRMILELAGTKETAISDISEFYPNPQSVSPIFVRFESINRLLGLDLPQEEVISILDKLKIYAGFDYIIEGNAGCFVTPPYNRLDLINDGQKYKGGTEADIIEEIGRVYGYNNIVGTPPKINFVPNISRAYFYKELVRAYFAENGFSELYNYSMVPAGEGEVRLLNFLSENTASLRKNLSYGFIKSLERNVRHLDFLGLCAIRAFEFGEIFTAGGEEGHLIIGVLMDNAKDAMMKEELDNIFGGLCERLKLKKDLLPEGAVVITKENPEWVLEINFDKFLEVLPMPSSYEILPRYPFASSSYERLSQYPYVTRDLAVFVPETISEKEISSKIRHEAGEDLIRITLFDVYKKGGDGGQVKVSYAFRLVFQNSDRTLTGEEVNETMERVYRVLADFGFEIR